jgi:hypothetical protein
MTDFSAFPLPVLAPDASPEFIDAETCKAWVENVPLANVAAAQQQLLSQIREFNRFSTSAMARLGALEAIREAVHFVQIEQAKRFTNRALPMSEPEVAVFQETLALWEQMRLGYLRCLEAAAMGDAAIRVQGALVAQRALAYSGLKMFHHYRAYRQVPAPEWRALHEAYARAEELDVAEALIKDYLNRDVHDTSPRIAYVRALLTGLCNPNELTQRQLTFVTYLLERWASKVEIGRTPPAWKDVPPLAVDLAGEVVPERVDPTAAQGDSIRFLDTDRLAKSLRNRVGLLRKGESPARLALGEDCVQPSCEQLLVFLYRQWCQMRATRVPERQRVSGVAQICNSIAGIHYFVSDRAFRQPRTSSALTHQEQDELATLGRVSTRSDDKYVTLQGFALELWQRVDQSAQGLKMVRKADTPGRRFAHGQLLAVRPSDEKNFLLAQVRWLMNSDQGDLYAGLKIMPGLPAAIAVRPAGVNAANEKYVPALLLTGVPAQNAPPSLILPAGWYKPKRIIEVYVELALRVRLDEVLERGSDFERVAYETLDA